MSGTHGSLFASVTDNAENYNKVSSVKSPSMLQKVTAIAELNQRSNCLFFINYAYCLPMSISIETNLDRNARA